MDVVLSGQVTQILPAQTGVSQRSGQSWMSQEYLLCHEPGQYPRNVCFRIFGEDKIKQFGIVLGEYVTVHLKIDAKQGKNGYFNVVDCWAVERQQQQMQQYAQPQYQQPQQQYQPQQQVQSPFPQQQVVQPAPAPQPAPQTQATQQQGLPFPPAQ